jgi:hypothetical protein
MGGATRSDEGDLAKALINHPLRALDGSEIRVLRKELFLLLQIFARR